MALRVNGWGRSHHGLRVADRCAWRDDLRRNVRRPCARNWTRSAAGSGRVLRSRCAAITGTVAHLLTARDLSADHHALQHVAVLGAVNALRLRLRPRGPRGLRALTDACAQRRKLAIARWPGRRRLCAVSCALASGHRSYSRWRSVLVMDEKGLSVTLQIVGPMKRSTFQKEAPDPIEQSIQDLLHWSWSTRLQIARLGRSIHGEFESWGAALA
jgi:hypothetical protein